MSQNETNLDGQSPDLAKTKQAALLAAIAQLSPEVLRDGQIDFEALKAQLGAEAWAGTNHYELSWAGKAEARMEVQKTTSHTITPDVGADAANLLSSADHVFIEGENLDVLRVLQKSYWGKVKMIYIDPPYNTGNDSFIYPDKYSETLAEYQRRTGERNADGYMNKRSIWKQNSKESGQYHSAWLSMMYPRLSLARNLLREDGVIFISIDDNEAANLKLLCDEVFGAENFVAQIIWEKKSSAKGVPPRNMMVNVHEYIFAYQKSDSFKFMGEKRDEIKDGFKNPDNDPRGAWRESNIKSTTKPIEQSFTIVDPDTGREYTNTWAFSKESLEKMISEGRILWKESLPKQKEFMAEMTNENKAIKSSWGVFDPQSTTVSLQKLLPEVKFDNPKPLNLMKYILCVGVQQNDLILDFFAGSGTTAHAVMQLNAEDGGNRRSISVQISEACDEKSEAYKAGYKTIADITRARITKAAAKIKADHPTTAANLDLACFKLAPSNFKVWQAPDLTVESLTEQLALFQATEKTPDHAPINAEAEKQAWQHALLTELLLKKGLGVLGVDVQASPQAVGDATLYRVLMPDAQVLYLCFDPYSVALKMAIVADQPAQVVLLNSCFVGDKADEQLSNLSLELATWDCRLEVI
jgi:adenine-specific DNA-methyltransferase